MTTINTGKPTNAEDRAYNQIDIMGSSPKKIQGDKPSVAKKQLDDNELSVSSSIPGTSPFRQAASLRLASSVASRTGSFSGSKPVAADMRDGMFRSNSNGSKPSSPRVQRGGFDESAIADDNDVATGSKSNDIDAITSRRGTRSHRASVFSNLSRTRSAAGTPDDLTSGHRSGSNSSAASVQSIDIDHPDPHVVKTVGRHLVRDSESDGSGADAEDKFASLKLQGGDITRQLYNWQQQHEDAGSSRGRSRSFDMPRDDTLVKDIKAPGGFRRNYIAQNVLGADHEALAQGSSPFLTRNFIEFLSLYGHFAGEELEEEEEGDDDDEFEPSERTALLRRQPSYRSQAQGASATKAVMLLLKSFVGTGVLFLPKAFLNGGLLFSSGLLIFVSIVSYWCFLLLIWTKEAVGVSSFGDIGGALYGPKMRHIILASIVLSQLGFAAAYIVFVSENLQAFLVAVFGTKPTVQLLIWAQMIFFLPFSMIRDIAKLSGTALVADFFIFLGLLYLFGWSFDLLATEGPADIVMFNPDSWTLFIGTAIFTFEGIGLIIPIQESMKKPEKFGPILAGVMIGITVLFVSAGAFLYASFGSQVQTVVLLNLPQDSAAVNTIQLLYSLAILLSIPLQLFPAIRILENGIFVKSGKYNRKVKWQKNIFRFALVIGTAFIAWGGADDLDKFVALIGSVACIPLVYIYPAFLHMKVVRNNLKFVIADAILCGAGVLAMAYTSYGTAKSWLGA